MTEAINKFISIFVGLLLILRGLLWISGGKESFQLTFEEIQEIAGIPIDHSFLKYKKELVDYGYQVGICLKKMHSVTTHICLSCSIQ